MPLNLPQKLILPLLLSAAVLLSATPILAKKMPSERKTITSKPECLANGGKWGLHGEHEKEFCILPAGDAGKTCRDSAECEGYCIAKLTPEEEKLLTGEHGKHSLKKTGACSEWQTEFGCFAMVNRGKVTGIICHD